MSAGLLMFHVVAIIAIFALGYMVGLDRAAGVASPSASTTTGQGTGAGHLKPPLKRKAVSSPLPFEGCHIKEFKGRLH